MEEIPEITLEVARAEETPEITLVEETLEVVQAEIRTTTLVVIREETVNRKQVNEQ